MKAPSTAFNKSKYYWFYHDHGHDIEEHIQQKDKIKALINEAISKSIIYGR